MTTSGEITALRHDVRLESIHTEIKKVFFHWASIIRCSSIMAERAERTTVELFAEAQKILYYGTAGSIGY